MFLLIFSIVFFIFYFYVTSYINTTFHFKYIHEIKYTLYGIFYPVNITIINESNTYLYCYSDKVMSIKYNSSNLTLRLVTEEYNGTIKLLNKSINLITKNISVSSHALVYPKGNKFFYSRISFPFIFIPVEHGTLYYLPIKHGEYLLIFSVSLQLDEYYGPVSDSVVPIPIIAVLSFILSLIISPLIYIIIRRVLKWK